MRNCPSFWTVLLQDLPPGAIVAGGAVRDYLLGVPPKDIDIFVETSEWDKPDDFFSLDGRAEKDQEYGMMSNIDVVARGTRFGYQVDLIGITLPNARHVTGKNLVPTFDFGITRCWFDGLGLHETNESRIDRCRQTVTLFHDDRMDRALARFDRFNARMGGTYKLQPATTKIAQSLKAAGRR